MLGLCPEGWLTGRRLEAYGKKNVPFGKSDGKRSEIAGGVGHM